MNRAGILKGETLAENNVRVCVEAIEIQVRLCCSESDAEVEQLACHRVQFRMSSKRADVVECAVEVEFATRLQRDGIELDRQPLFAESQQPPRIMKDADVDRRFEHHSAFQPVRLERRSKSAEQWTSRLFLGNQPGAADKAAGEFHSPRLKSQEANHPIAVEPVVVTKISPRETCGSVHVVSASDKIRKVTFNMLDGVRLFARRERK